MPIISQVELTGSPVEQASWQKQTYWWDPTNELSSGETTSAPTCMVLKYDPQFPYDTADVTATVVQSGFPVIDTGARANQVKVPILANTLVAGFEYRVQMTCVGSLGATPGRFFRIICRV